MAVGRGISMAKTGGGGLVDVGEEIVVVVVALMGVFSFRLLL